MLIPATRGWVTPANHTSQTDPKEPFGVCLCLRADSSRFNTNQPIGNQGLHLFIFPCWFQRESISLLEIIYFSRGLNQMEDVRLHLLESLAYFEGSWPIGFQLFDINRQYVARRLVFCLDSLPEFLNFKLFEKNKKQTNHLTGKREVWACFEPSTQEVSRVSNQLPEAFPRPACRFELSQLQQALVEPDPCSLHEARRDVRCTRTANQVYIYIYILLK